MKRLLLSGLFLLSVVAAYARPRPVADSPPPAQLKVEPSGSQQRSSLSNDTIYFGGTRWAPDSMRWEAIKDSVWTFDTGVGSFIKEAGKTYPNVDPYKPDGFHGGMEGWTGWDWTYNPVYFFRRLSALDSRWEGAPCVGNGTGLGGDYSFWVGALPAEAESLCFAAGKGYGNFWHVCIEHTFEYPGGDVTLSFLYSVDAEPDYDYAFAFCDTGGTSPSTVASYTGLQGGAANLPLRQGEQLPVGPKPIKLRFCFDSDAAWSDEDGLQPTDCGAFAVDNIGLSGGITHFADFENSDDGWKLSSPEPGLGGDWSNLVALADLPPPENLTGCAFRDSVLVFFDPASAGHPPYQNNVAISPWIDFDRAGVDAGPGYFIDLDGYFYLPLRNYIFVATAVQWFPDTCSTTGQAHVSPWRTNGFYNFSSGPICREKKPLTIDFSNVIPPKIKELRFAVGVVNYCRFFSNCTGLDNSSPWFDNLRFATHNFITIQDAIDRAAAGDTVWVPPGTYTGTGNVDLTFRGKNIVLKSATGAEHTIIDGSGSHRGLVCDDGEDSTAAAIGFTFRNCTAPNDSGGAVYLGSGLSIRFEDCTFANCQATWGGGIFSPTDAHPSFLRCVFANNVAKFAGGGAFVGGGRFVDCAFDSNTTTYDLSYYGGSIFMPYSSGSSEFFRVSVRDTRNGWGAILDGDARVQDCVFERNQGGGLNFGGLGVIRGSSFIDNLGQGLVFNPGHLSPCGQWTHVSNCQVVGNSEGGISGCGGAVDSTLIQGNKKHGGIYAIGTRVTDCKITENSGGYGGGMSLDGGVVENCVISGNSAQYGGGIWGYSYTYLDQPFRIRNCLIYGNRALQGGGLWVDRFLSAEPPHVAESTIASNRAARGGGVYLGREAPLSLESCILWENEADDSGAQVFSADVSDSLIFTCCNVDTTGIDGYGYVNFEGPQVFASPLFCRPALASNAPTIEGDYTLAFDSPCLPMHSPCESLIGALGLGCDVVSILPPPTPQEPPFLKTPGIHSGPNPFTQTLTIHYLSPIGTDPELEIFSVDGRLVGKWSLRPGSGAVTWNGTDPIGKSAASGIYLLRYTAGDLRVVRRVVRITS